MKIYIIDVLTTGKLILVRKILEITRVPVYYLNEVIHQKDVKRFDSE